MEVFSARPNLCQFSGAARGALYHRDRRKLKDGMSPTCSHRLDGIAYGAEMINPTHPCFEFLDLQAKPTRRGRNPDRFRSNGTLRAVQTADMPAEAEETSIWRCRSKIYLAVWSAQEIRL